MSVWGADVEALEALAKRMLAGAESLEYARSNVRSLLYSVPWLGEDAGFFRSEWDGPHSTRLVAAVAVLREAARVLETNAAQQRRASEGDGGGGGGQSWWQAVRNDANGAWHRFDRTADDGVLKDIGYWFGVPGFAAHTNKILRMEHLAVPAFAKDVAQLDKLPAVKVVSGVFTAITMAQHAGHIVEDVHGHRTGELAYEGAATASDALKMSKDPVTYMAGVNVAIWSDVVKSAHQVNWHQGVPNPLQGDNLRTVWAPAFGDAAKTVFRRLPGYFL